MFYEVGMRRLVVVEPQELGGVLHTQRAMFRRLLKDVDEEGGDEEYGLFVAVTTVEGVSEGRVRSGTGAVVFTVNFKCIVFKLQVDEVVEVEVTQVVHNGFFAACGPALMYVPRKEMTGFKFQDGPSQEFNTWRDSTGSLIAPKALVRTKVVGLKWDPIARAQQALGSLNGDMLGMVIEDDEF